MAITFDNIAGGELAEKFKMALAQIVGISWTQTWILRQPEE